MDDPVSRCAGDVARLLGERLGGPPPSEGALAALMAGVGDRIARALAAREGPAPACGPGCAACCTVNVGTLACEGAAIAAFLRARLGPQARAAAGPLLAFHDRVRWLEDGERIRARLACPFLDAARACTIHPVRPLACRSVSSLDAEECRRAIAARGEDEEGEGTVRMDLLQRALHDAAREALAAGARARGLDARLRDVTGMAGAFLADPGLAPAWAAGARVPIE